MDGWMGVYFVFRGRGVGFVARRDIVARTATRAQRVNKRPGKS
jgi:hypothetical protein